MVRYSHQITKQKQPKQRFYLRFFTGGFKMSVITFVCAGQMNSAITFPAFENGHEVRLVDAIMKRSL